MYSKTMVMLKLERRGICGLNYMTVLGYFWHILYMMSCSGATCILVAEQL